MVRKISKKEAVQITMPRSVAMWLVDNTTLTVGQISKFCDLPALEVQAMLDGEFGEGIQLKDPVFAGYTTKEFIEAAEKDVDKDLKKLDEKYNVKIRKEKAYIPLAMRSKKLDAIAWFISSHPYVANVTLKKVLGTTDSTIEKIRNRTHANMDEISPKDPIMLGFISRNDLEGLLKKEEEKYKQNLKKAQ